MSDSITIKVPGDLKYAAFVQDTGLNAVKKYYGIDNDEDCRQYLDESRILFQELFTNAVEHTKSDEIKLVFEFTGKSYKLEIETTGDGFKIKPAVKYDNTDVLTVPYPSEFIGKEFLIYSFDQIDIMCRILDEYRVELFRIDSTDKNMDADIPVHFGLYIITAVAGEIKAETRKDRINLFSLKRKAP